jgi:hypothetical protein
MSKFNISPKTCIIEEALLEKDVWIIYKDGEEDFGIRVPLKQGHECPRCNSNECFISVYGPHYKLVCTNCHTRIKWHPKTPWLRALLEPVDEPTGTGH